MTIHLRYAGKTKRLSHAPETHEPEEILRYLRDKGYLPLDHFPVVVDRHPDGVVIRPPAVFG